MSEKTCVILNPASAAGTTGRRQHSVIARIEAALGPVELRVTAAPGDATRLAKDATESGCRRIIVAGGDGTLSEIANGILAATKGASGGPAIGLLPLGSGWDFARTLGLPRVLMSPSSGSSTEGPAPSTRFGSTTTTTEALRGAGLS